jgi:glucose-6-phosphate 1-dehydrogenase
LVNWVTESIEGIRNTPTIMVVFGATGDLARRKIVPALFHLFEQNRLPDRFEVVGFSRRDIPTNDWRRYIDKHITEHLSDHDPLIDDFTASFTYLQGMFEERAAYDRLADRLAEIEVKWKVCANKIFYLAVPPQFYREIFKNLSESGLTAGCSDDRGWTRIMVEKPFGKNLNEARELDELLGSLFKEEQIYRVDHYLAKEVLQNILLFRFANNLMEDVWNREYIDQVEIKLLENIGMDGRGSFYDGVGALLDVGQNHLLQMMALTTMERPRSFESGDVRAARAEVLEKIRILSDREVAGNTIRGQYHGYRDEQGVADDSKTETYFKVRATLDSPRWEGVPFFLEGGKKLGRPRKEIVVRFRHPAPCLCPPGVHYRNTVHFRLEPEPGISIKFWSKKPGDNMGLEEQKLDFKYKEAALAHSYLEEYSKLLSECIAGDQTLFISSRETMAGWRFIDPIIENWRHDSEPLHSYSGDTILETARALSGMVPKTGVTSKTVGVIGLGKMGRGMAEHLLDKGWAVAGLNRSPAVTRSMETEGLSGAFSPRELVEKLQSPRVVWLMVPAGEPVENYLFGVGGLSELLEPGDIVIDGGNSFYRDSIRRHQELTKRGIKFVDCGVSGGPAGARHGASLMIGGERETYDYLRPLFVDIAAPGAERYFEGPGAGHFVKMVHNGIEYGMMQAIAEGFTIIREAQYDIDPAEAADIYNHASVIESRLVGWLKSAYEEFGADLKGVSGRVSHTGEAESTMQTARELDVKDKVIEDALTFRVESESHPSYTGRILTVLRGKFGGHEIRSDDEKRFRKIS